jgi:hypothetical protein
MIQEFVQDIKEFSRLYIWLPRCEAVNKWEIRHGITRKVNSREM